MNLFEWDTVQPLAILPNYFDNVLQTKNSHSSTETILKKPACLLPHTQNLPLRDNIAVLPINSVIFPTENLLSQLLGATTLDQLTSDFQQALENPAISEIIFNIDSP